jgi:Tfp pilus assembly protein FimT
MAGNMRTLERHAYLAGVKAVKEDNTTYATRADIAFSQEGTPRSVESMMTILIYYQGYEQEGRRIMISKGGRIRMERGQHGG